MAKATYDEALARLLAHEGGYSNHPSDPGGPTNFGITIADYRRYAKPDATAADVRAMRIDEAKAIYRARYWDAMRCDELPAGLDYALFDYGVNSGVGRAVKVLQRLTALADDGRMADAVVAAAQKADARDLVARLCDERLAFLKSLKTWPTFGRGWARRVSEVKAVALAMAAQAVPQRAPAPGKGIAPPKRPARRGFAGAAAAIAAVFAGCSGILHQLDKETIMETVIALLVAVLAGYVASVFTWPRARQALVGVDNEIDDLRAKARALEAQLLEAQVRG